MCNPNKTITLLNAPNPFPLPEREIGQSKHCIRSGYYEHTGKWYVHFSYHSEVLVPFCLN